MRKTDYETFINKFKPEMDERGESFKQYDDTDFSYQKAFDKAGEGNKFLWTVVDGSGRNLYILPGFHFVNRMFYIITEIPWNEKTRNYVY